MNENKKLSHVDDSGKVMMVNVSEKSVTHRIAIAKAVVELPEDVAQVLTHQHFQVAKGPVIQTAILAGVMAAKNTGNLIPLCHPIGLDGVNIDIQLKGNEFHILSTAFVHAKTGVEMEALTGASVAALTIYDMCKALSHHIVIREVKLMKKSGGKHEYERKA